MKNTKSITVKIDRRLDIAIDYAFVIKSIDVDKVTFEKFNVDCRNKIESAWENDDSNYIIEAEIILGDKISTMTLFANAKAVEKAVQYAGEIVKNIVMIRTPKARKVKLTDIELFEEI